MDLLSSSCLPLYSNCTLAREEVKATWVRQASKPSDIFFSLRQRIGILLLWQAVADTELYGSLGEMLGCESTSEIFNSTEVGVIRFVLEENYWRQDL